MLGKMYESDIGEWILYKDHNDDYLRRWEMNNEDNRTFILKQYMDSRLINKLKFSIYILSASLILALVF
jgi:hypothetical protein